VLAHAEAVSSDRYDVALMRDTVDERDSF